MRRWGWVGILPAMLALHPLERIEGVVAGSAADLLAARWHPDDVQQVEAAYCVTRYDSLVTTTATDTQTVYVVLAVVPVESPPATQVAVWFACRDGEGKPTPTIHTHPPSDCRPVPMRLRDRFFTLSPALRYDCTPTTAHAVNCRASSQDSVYARHNPAPFHVTQCAARVFDFYTAPPPPAPLGGATP